MAAQWPRVKAWAVANLNSLTGWDAVTVIGGVPATGDRPTKYAIVGWTPPDGDGGEFSTTRDPDGFQTQEVGTLHIYLVCQGGEVNPAMFEDAAFALYDQLDAEIRRNRTLDGTLSDNSRAELSAVPSIAQTNTALTITLSYFTVTT